MSEASNKTHMAEKQAVLLEEDLALLEEELSDKYYQLGKSIYEAADRRVEEINRLVDRVVETRVKLSGVRGQTVCLSCLSPNPRANLYCGKCGARLEARDCGDCDEYSENKDACRYTANEEKENGQ